MNTPEQKHFGDDPELEAIRHAGMASFDSNRGKLINPYVAGTPRHDMFERGWSHAAKMSPGKYDEPIRRFPWESSGEYTIVRDGLKHNAYADAKGGDEPRKKR